MRNILKLLILLFVLSCSKNEEQTNTDCSGDYTTAGVLVNIDKNIFNNDESVNTYSRYSWSSNGSQRVLNGNGIPNHDVGTFPNSNNPNTITEQSVSKRFTLCPNIISERTKIENKPEVLIWGSGKPKREFLFVDDMAKASIHIMNLDKKVFDQHTLPMCSHINVGSGMDLSIKELAEAIKEVVDFKGEINFDSNMPDGVKRKLLNIDKIQKFGWNPIISLDDGLKLTYQAFQDENKGYLDEA